MKANYSARGYQVYGDLDNVKKDLGTLKDILDRQGSDIVLEAIAEQIGHCKLKFNLSSADLAAIVSSIKLSLDDLIGERT
jgi:hypothetical protein